MTLRKALEDVASNSRADRERGAAVLLKELQQLARREGGPKEEQDDAVGDVARSLLQLCARGVPSSLPTDDAGTRRYLARSIRNWRRKQASSSRAVREVSSTVEGDGQEERETAAYREAEIRVGTERSEDSARTALGGELFEAGVEYVRELARGLIERRLPRYHAETARSWNELVDFYSGKPLDDLILAAGEVPSTKTRNQRYTNFKRLRAGLEAALDASAWSPEKLGIARAFIETVLLRPGEVSDLSRLRVSAAADAGETGP